MRLRWIVIVGLMVMGTLVAVAWQPGRDAEQSPTVAATISTTTVTPATASSTPLRVVILGDSYTQLDQWAGDVADAANWDHDNLALSGTGYVSTAGRSACGLDVCPNFSGQLDAAARLVPAADVVIITGGVNDPTGEVVVEAVHDTYAKARRLFPDATIVGFSPFGKATEYPDSLVALRSVVQREVEGVGGVFVDVGHPLADRPDLIRGDGLHPTDEGQHVLAQAVIAALRAQAPDLLR